MSKSSRRIWKIGIGYQYAPETCFVTELQRDGTYKKLDIDLSNSMCGYHLAIGKKEKALAEMKHLVRSNKKAKKRLATYGFYLKGSTYLYVYCTNTWMFAGQYDIAKKLEIYKTFKEYWLKRDCKYQMSMTAKLDGTYNVISTKNNFEEVDLSRPLKVYINLV